MQILTSILLVIAGILIVLFLLALVLRKNHFVKREIIINTPSQKVFEYIRLLRNQDAFNKHAMVDPERQREFKGIDGNEGYIYSWSGDKSAGEGEKEIIRIIEGKSIETEIRFIKPMKTSARILMETQPLAANQTRVIWSNSGKLNYPINLLIPVMEKSVAKGMDESLANLKRILEN